MESVSESIKRDTYERIMESIGATAATIAGHRAKTCEARVAYGLDRLRGSIRDILAQHIAPEDKPGRQEAMAVVCDTSELRLVLDWCEYMAVTPRIVTRTVPAYHSTAQHYVFVTTSAQRERLCAFLDSVSETLAA